MRRTTWRQQPPVKNPKNVARADGSGRKAKPVVRCRHSHSHCTGAALTTFASSHHAQHYKNTFRLLLAISVRSGHPQGAGAELSPITRDKNTSATRREFTRPAALCGVGLPHLYGRVERAASTARADRCAKRAARAGCAAGCLLSESRTCAGCWQNSPGTWKRHGRALGRRRLLALRRCALLQARTCATAPYRPASHALPRSPAPHSRRASPPLLKPQPQGAAARRGAARLAAAHMAEMEPGECPLCGKESAPDSAGSASRAPCSAGCDFLYHTECLQGYLKTVKRGPNAAKNGSTPCPVGSSLSANPVAASCRGKVRGGRPAGGRLGRTRWCWKQGWRKDQWYVAAPLPPSWQVPRAHLRPPHMRAAPPPRSHPAAVPRDKGGPR